MNMNVVRPLVAGTLLALLLPTACARTEAPPPAAPPPPTVPVVEVTPETITVSSEWVATLDGQVNAQIRPQVSGYLVRRVYQEGGAVRKGDVLFEIDARTFTVALAQAEARLAETRAQLGRAERDVARNTPLAKERAIAQSQLDNDIQAQMAAQASVKAAEAAVDAARLNIEFTRVRSLVDGVAAIATAQIGDLVGPQTLLTTVSQVDPIRAYFSLSEREYLELAGPINARTTKRLWSGGNGLRLTLADGTDYPLRGRFQSADRQIDSRTGTMRVSAAFPNPRYVLRPGQYGRVHIETRTVANALLVPQRAVTEAQSGSQVRIVGTDGTVQLRPVQMGSRVGSRWIVERGLSAGDRVVVDAGQLAEGLPVKTKPFVEPAATDEGRPAGPLTQPPPSPGTAPVTPPTGGR
jgi:RND family efflux transporter MFP subunit